MASFWWVGLVQTGGVCPTGPLAVLVASLPLLGAVAAHAVRTPVAHFVQLGITDEHARDVLTLQACILLGCAAELGRKGHAVPISLAPSWMSACRMAAHTA